MCCGSLRRAWPTSSPSGRCVNNFFSVLGGVLVSYEIRTYIHGHAQPPPLTTPPYHFKKAMDDLDARCLCLGDGQEGRDRASVSRRLVLPAPHASLVVRLDPADPRGVSEFGVWNSIGWVGVWVAERREGERESV